MLKLQYFGHLMQRADSLEKTLMLGGRGLGPRDALKKDSRGLSRVAAGNPSFPRLLQGTIGPRAQPVSQLNPAQ